MTLQEAQGFGFALAAMVLYGLYMVPRRSTGVSQGVFTFWMGCGIVAGTSVIGLLYGGVVYVTLAQGVLIVASGAIWATGTHSYCRGVQLIGLSRSTPVKNTSAMLGTLLGIFLFHEFAGRHLGSVVMVIAGSLAVVVSATLLSRVESTEEDDVMLVDRRRYVYGILCSAWAAVAFSLYTIPIKISYKQGVTPSAFLFYMGIGVFIGMTLIALGTGGFRPGKMVTSRDRNLALTSGVMWAIGSMCQNLAVKLVGVAVTWPLTKNTVVAVLFGVLVLKEVDPRRHWRDLWVGLALSVVGVVLLGLAMGQ